MASLIVILGVTNIIFGASYYEWESPLPYIQTAIFFILYALSSAFTKKRFVRYLYPLVGVVLLFLTALGFTLAGRDCLLLTASLFMAQTVASLWHVIQDFNNEDKAWAGRKKVASLAMQALLGVFLFVLLFVRKELDRTAAQGVTLAAAALLSLSTILGASTLKGESGGTIRAARIAFALLIIGVTIDFILRGQVDHRPSMLFSCGLMGLFALLALLFAFWEHKKKLHDFKALIASDVILCLALAAFLIIVNTGFVRWKYFIQQAASGAVLIAALIHIIFTIESAILARGKDPFLITPLLVGIVGFATSIVFGFFTQESVGVAIIGNLMLIIPAVRAMFLHRHSPMGEKMPVIILIIACVLSAFFSYLAAYVTWVKEISVIMMNLGVMGVALILILDLLTDMQGHLTGFIATALLITGIIQAALGDEYIYLSTSCLALTVMVLFVFAANEHKKRSCRWAKIYCTVMALASMVFFLATTIKLSLV